MRITDSSMVTLAHITQQRTNYQLNEVYEQIATGTKLNRYSDDPVAYARTAILDQNLKLNEQYTDTIGVVQLEYSKYEAHLDTLDDISLRVNELILQGNNDTLDSDAREGITIELESLKEQILEVLNTKDGNRYMFSGTSIDVPAIDETQPYLVTGNGNYREVRVSDTVTYESNITAQDVLGSSDILNHIDAVIAEYTTPTAAFETVTSAAIDSTLDFQTSVLSELSKVGGNMNSLDRMISANEDISVYSEAIRAELNDVDYAEASINLNKHLTTLEASQKTFLQLMSNTLFELI